MMSLPVLSSKEALFLWRLATTGGEAWNKDVKPTLKRAERERLTAVGLVSEAKRKAPEGRGTPLHLTLTEAGWAWLSANLDADLTSRLPAGTVVLTLLLRRLKSYLDRSDASLADLLVAPPASPAPSLFPDAAPAPGDLSARVASAYYALSDGQPNFRVRLADLRRRLPDVPREDLDQALLKLDADGVATLFRLDDPREIHAEDREAVLFTPAGDERHIVYLEGSAS